MARSAPRHDRDAGGPADVLAAKAALREEVWSAMRAARVARFPLDLIVTPDRVIDCRPWHAPRPAPAIAWDDLTDEKIAAIPLLSALRRQG